MSALAVVERELRVSARWKYTGWLRLLVGGLAALVVARTLMWANQSPVIAANAPGKQALQTLSWLALVFCLIEGVRQTHDCISSERRDGTLGLLLLTPLRGFEVVLGKTASASVNALLALLAAFPAMAVALPAGGTTAGEFWRAQLVLLNTLFLSLACGVFASARSQTAQRALLGAAAILATLCALPAFVTLLGPTFFVPVSPPMAMNWSESGLYQTAPERYWISMAVIPAAAWILIRMAGRRLDAQLIQSDAAAAPAPSDQEQVAAPSYRPSPSLHARPRASPIEENPARWLAQRPPNGRLLVWTAVAIMALLDVHLALLVRVIGIGVANSGIWTAVAILNKLLPALLLTLAASRSLTEARRNGTLELLLCTPLSSRSIVQGFWGALWKSLKLPFFVLAAVVIAKILMATPAFLRLGGFFPRSFAAGPFFVQAANQAQPLLTMLAVAWAALWFSARARRQSYVVGLTLLWTVLIPWIGAQVYWLLVSGFVRGAAAGPAMPPLWLWLLLGGASWGALLYLIALIRWTRRQLFERFRDTVATVHSR